MNVFIGGDVWPLELGDGELARNLGLSQKPDLCLFTLDACLPAGPPREGHAHFPFPPEALEGFKLGETNVAVTASNHLGDFGPEGFRATLRELELRHFLTVGSGDTLAAAQRPLAMNTPAGRIGVLAFAETVQRVAAVPATATSPGVNPWDEQAALAAVREARRGFDAVWVILHWGEEFVRYPDPTQRAAAHALVEAGASLVVASHTHVPLGFEQVGDATIFYGLGNFLYGGYQIPQAYRYQWHPMGQVGLVVEGSWNGRWTWRPRAIAHDRWGVPHAMADVERYCPDLGAQLPWDPRAYARRFPWLRRKERLEHITQRLAYMSADERLYRLGRLLGRANP